MKRVLVMILFVTLSLSVVWMAANAASPWPGESPPITPTPSQKSEAVTAVEDAIQEKIENERATTAFFWESSISIADTQVSSDGGWATSMLVPVDTKAEIAPETEPALVVSSQVDGEWQVFFPNTPGWLEMIENTPDNLLSPEHKEVYRLMNMTAAVNVPTTALSGYLLPWDAGVSYYLTGSTCHDDYIPSGNAHYAFDFAYNRTMWDILAAKNAEVWVWKDDVPTCYEPSCWRDQPVGNYIVLRDTSTNPVTYHLYLHLKQGSIPEGLKVRGQRVLQGQFIGIVDNTGQSSGSHLHFQVQVPYLGEDHYWGRSVDITFDDVAINGGRPRIHKVGYCWDFNYCDRPGDVCETSQLYYTSENVRQGIIDTTPPIGDLVTPTTGGIHTDELSLEGWAQDLGTGTYPPIGLESAQFIAYYEGAWHDIGPSFMSAEFSYDWDWCDQDVPDGPVSVALRLQDFHGNQSPGLPGLRHVSKRYACPTLPACQPAVNQIAIFSKINYQGDCQVLDIGNYASSAAFGNVGNDNTRSLRIGSNVHAELFTENAFTGRTEAISADDANLSENAIGNATLSSLKVIVGSAAPERVTTPQTRIDLVNKDLLDAPTLNVTAPFSDTLEGSVSGWSTSGLWHLSEVQSRSSSHSWRYGNDTTNDYDTALPNNGALTTLVINLPISTDPYMLQFWYRYETESHYAHWDQRWVQISVDGGPYVNAVQLYDDPMGGWVKARIDLLPYANPSTEHTLQARFFFDSIDANNNGYEGWYIDDIQVAAEPISVCQTDDYEPNDQPGQAAQIAYGSTTTNAAICPGWDKDFYKFTGTAGDRIVADIEAKTSGSELDGYLFLLDSDGSSELAESDDELMFTLQDPLLGYLLPRDGTYYLKFRAWDYPAGNGSYSLDLFTDDQNPSAVLDFPEEDSFLKLGIFDFTALAVDSVSGIHYVQFLYHTSNWLAGDWIEIGRDYDGSDGWSVPFDTTNFSDGDTISVYMRAFDWAGNWAPAAAWNVGIDAKPPTVTIEPLANPSQSTALHLEWSATDSGSGIEVVNVERKINNAAWTIYLPDTNLTETWFIGQADTDYAFRVHARDRAGYEAVTDPTSSAIPPISILCSNPDDWDVDTSNNDNTFEQATEIVVGDPTQNHNFCNPAASDRLNDQDWVQFTAKKGEQYILRATPIGESTAVMIRFFAADGTTLLAETTAHDFGATTQLIWEASQSGPVYVQLQHSDGRVAGNGVSYTIKLFTSIVYLPLAQR